MKIKTLMHNTKWATAAALAPTLLLGSIPTQANDLGVTVNGQPVAFSGQGPIENSGRVLVPLRGVLEKLGAYVSYDSARQEVSAVRNESHILLPIGSAMARIDHRPVTLDAPARIVNGSTMVPLRFVAEALGARVDYQAATSTVAIRTGAGGINRDRPLPPIGSANHVLRGTLLSVHPRESRLVIQDQEGNRRDVALAPDYLAQRRTPGGGAVTIDLYRLHPGGFVALEMYDGAARTVTLLPDRNTSTR